MSVPGLPVLNYRVLASANTLEFWWQAPLNDGGSQINSYTLLCSSIPYSTVIGASTFYAKVSTLTNTQNYTFQLAATNTVGTGPFNPYTISQPGTRAAGVTNLAVSTIDATTANVVWAFTNNAGEATNKFFALSVYPSSASISSFMLPVYPNQRSQIVSNLSTTFYTFLVQAMNDAGYSFPTVSTLQLLSVGPSPVVYLYATTYSGSGTWNDSSGNNKNATLETGVRAKNTAGNGIVLNGSTSYTFPNVSVGNSWSFSLWYKNTMSTAGITGSSAILNQIHSPSPINISVGDPLVGTFVGFFNSGWFVGASISSYLTTNTWINIIGTWNGTTLVVYINGTQVQSTVTGGTSADGGAAYRIGRRYDNSAFVTGEIGEVRIYNTPLTSLQVLDLYTTTAPIYMPSPLVYLYATTYSGVGTWNDTSGNGKNATLEVGTRAKNAVGNGVVLNGSTSWTFPNVSPGNSWSVSVWYKNKLVTNGITAVSGIVSQIWSNGNLNISVAENTGGIRVGFRMSSGSWFSSKDYTSSFTPNTWVNLIGTWDGTNLNTYVNGPLSESIQPGGTAVDNGSNYVIGRRSDGGNYLTGEIGEVRIYGSPLSAAQVSNLYTTTAAAYTT